MSVPPRELSRLLARAEDHAVPLSALVELTHACNVHCEHCYLDLVSDKKIGALSTAEWKRVFTELSDEGCMFLTLSGGELLLRRDWFELATHARGLGLALRLYTNGTLVDDACADRIASLDPLAVEISLLGATSGTHDATSRSPGSFDKIIAAVRRLRAREVPVVLKTVVTRRNAHELGAIRTLAAQLTAKLHLDAEITPKNDGSREPKALELRQDELVSVLGELEPGGACAHAAAVGLEERLDDVPCAAGRRTCHIDPAGRVFPCTQWPEPVGDLREQRFGDIWRNAERLNALRATRIRDLDGCASCGLVTACNPCMALSLLEQGDLRGPSETKCRTAAARAELRGELTRPPVLPRRGTTVSSLVTLRRSKAEPALPLPPPRAASSVKR